MPPRLAAGLRRYQLHQGPDTACELRLVVRGAAAREIETRLGEAWRAVDAPDGGLALRIAVVPAIEGPGEAKVQSFTSVFFDRPFRPC